MKQQRGEVVDVVQEKRPASARSSRENIPAHDRIAQRAYELFLARGGQPGHHEDDWYQAERELGSGRN